MRAAAFILFLLPVAVAGAGSEVRDGAIPVSLTGVAGDPTRGLAMVRDMQNASCLICHALPIPDEPDMGTLGPDLTGVASRYSEGELRLRLVDARRVVPDTIMPPYFSSEGLTGVRAQFRGKPIYSAQEVEDVLAYLLTLKGD